MRQTSFINALNQRQDVAFLWRSKMRTSCRHQCALIECVFVWVSLSQQVFVGKTWPQFLTSNAEFSLTPPNPTSPSSLCFVYSPWSCPNPAPPHLLFPSLSPFLHRPTLTCLLHVPLHPAGLFIIPTFACIPLTEILFCLDRRRKTVRRWHPPPAAQMDYKRMPHT